MTRQQRIAVLDAGGQYCHLIARRLRQIGVHAEVKACETPSTQLKNYAGIVISGGPASVEDPTSPNVDPTIFDLRVPVLGICYGHQLMARILGGTVVKAKTAEYGPAHLKVLTADSLFKDLGTDDPQPVWMNHRDTVRSVPDGFEVMGATQSCPVAAMGHHLKRFYGVQFHPEVVHTQRGTDILRAFSVDICKCQLITPDPNQQVQRLKSQIRRQAAGRKVFFLVSGGVDSSVAFALCAEALGGQRVVGLYVDTGFMRKQDRADVERLIRSTSATIHIKNAQDDFIKLLRDTYNPEEKRRKIGDMFVEMHNQALNNLVGGSRNDWLLGQGTIYPDTIESGGTKLSSKIKTHHNRVEMIQELIREGRVIEPLSEFYKDEVRVIGRTIGLDKAIVDKQPFPGPGLAVRCLASTKPSGLQPDPKVVGQAADYGLKGAVLDLKTVGIKGDERCYQKVAILAGDIQSDNLEIVASQITNECTNITRVVYLLTRDCLRSEDWTVVRTDVSPKRVKLLRDADDLVYRALAKYHDPSIDRIWQFPVVLIPLVYLPTGAETIVLRPVESVDGMTASFSKLPRAVLLGIADELHSSLGVEVLYDITNKPPATIEWE